MLVRILLALFVLLALLAGWGMRGQREGKEARIETIAGRCFGTYYQIKVRTDQELGELPSRITAELDRISAHMSIHDANSELSLLNQAPAKQWLDLSPDMERLLRMTQQVYQLSEGCFDPTVGALVELWGFGRQKSAEKTIPSRRDIARALASVGFDKIALHPHKSQIMKESPHVIMNLSALAKGYGVDRIATLLREHGYEHFIVEIGGEILASGSRSEQEQGWHVAIERPSSQESQGQQLVLTLKNQALATSGNYRNYFTKGGKNYAHTISPQTGYPVDNGIVSVSVVSSHAAEADALATAIMAMPAERVPAFIQENQLAVIYMQVDADGELRVRSTLSLL